VRNLQRAAFGCRNAVELTVSASFFPGSDKADTSGAKQTSTGSRCMSGLGGRSVTITTRPIVGDATCFSTTYRRLPRDVKRGDIASTGEMYARAHLAGEFAVDMITVNPYMGHDAILPYVQHLDEKGIFALIRTSNPSARDFQELACDGRPLFLKVASRVAEWGANYIGRCGYSAIGGVVGATGPEQLAAVRSEFPSIFFLVPGYGAQGGGGKDVAPAFREGNGAVVNASRPAPRPVPRPAASCPQSDIVRRDGSDRLRMIRPLTVRKWSRR